MLDFIISYGFIFEVLVASGLFVHSLARRKFFVLRLASFIIFFCSIAIAWIYIFEDNLISQIIRFTSLFIIRVCGILFCFKTNLWVALFCEIGAFATAHFIYKLALLIYSFSSSYPIIYNLLYIIAFITVYALSYLIFAKKIERKEAMYLESKQIILLGSGLIIFIIIFQLVSEIYFDATPLPMFIIVVFYDLLLCLFTLCILFGMFKTGQLQKDYSLMEHLFYLKKEQLETSKKNIDMVNIKCHDLKHQISLLGDRISRDELDELKKIITIYDSSIKTGNDAMDVILAEKSLFCERNNIKLNCIADGKSLSFIRTSDIYSLFGNAIDNAIESVEKIDEEENRIISLSVKESMGMVAIHLENYFIGQLSVEQGLPITTKKNKDYHGFGMKSIKLLTEKYNGDFSFYVSKNKFNLDILLPIPEK